MKVENEWRGRIRLLGSFSVNFEASEKNLQQPQPQPKDDDRWEEETQYMDVQVQFASFKSKSMNFKHS